MNKERLTSGVITLTSDFGDRFALAQVELVIHSINPRVKLVVLSNEVTPFSILEGAFLLAKSYQYSPRHSIHIGVVDPGVGSGRRGLLIRTQNHWFVGPDNGLLYPAATDDGIEEVFVLDEGKLNSRRFNTFHGRDVFAPAAARISLGESPLKFARSVDKETICPYNLEPDQVAHIDSYGNVKLTSSPDGLKLGDQVNVNGTTATFRKTFADAKRDELLVYRGSHDTLELAINFGSAAEALQLAVGQRLKICNLRGIMQEGQICQIEI